MSSESLIVIVLVGVIAAWLAGQIVRGTGYGIINDLVIGVIGAFIGGWLLPRLGIYLGSGIIAAIIDADGRGDCAAGSSPVGSRRRPLAGTPLVGGQPSPRPAALVVGADGGGRTRTAKWPKDFKSFASTGFATSAQRALSHKPPAK